MSTRSTDFLLFIFAFLSRVNKQELGLYEKGLNSLHSLYKLQTFLKTNLLWSTVALQCCVSFCCTPQRISYIYTLILDSLYISILEEPDGLQSMGSQRFGPTDWLSTAHRVLNRVPVLYSRVLLVVYFVYNSV